MNGFSHFNCLSINTFKFQLNQFKTGIENASYFALKLKKIDFKIKNWFDNNAQFVILSSRTFSILNLNLNSPRKNV